MSARAPRPVSVGQVPLRLASPGEYLAALRARLVSQYPGWVRYGAILGEIDSLLKARPPAASDASVSTGYDKNDIRELFDREWLDSEWNEFQELLDFVKPARALKGARRVVVCGGGLCRIADPIAALPSVERVACTDLSWEMVYFGRSLATGDHEGIPLDFSRTRAFYRFSRKEKSFIRKNRELRYAPAIAPKRLAKVDFAVADAFAIDPMLEGDVLVAPFLLDAFVGPQFQTLLIRLCQQRAAGQSLLIVMTLSAGRPPEKLLEIIRASGLDVVMLEDRPNLSYSFSRVDFGFVRSEWHAVVVKAVKVDAKAAQRSGERVGLSVAMSPAGLEAFRKAKDDTLVDGMDPLQSRYLIACAKSATCAELDQRLRKMKLPDGALGHALGSMTSSGLVKLQLL